MKDETMGNQQVRLDRLVYWLSGVIDGEGCIMLTWKRYKKYENLEPQVSVSNNDVALLNSVCHVLRELQVGYYIVMRPKRASAILVKGFKRVGKLLPLIYPILVSKRDEAETVLRFLTIRKQEPYKRGYSEEERNLYQKCRNLKRSKNLRDYTPTLPEFEGQDDIVQTNAKSLEARGNCLPASL